MPMPTKPTHPHPKNLQAFVVLPSKFSELTSEEEQRVKILARLLRRQLLIVTDLKSLNNVQVNYGSDGPAGQMIAEILQKEIGIQSLQVGRKELLNFDQRSKVNDRSLRQMIGAWIDIVIVVVNGSRDFAGTVLKACMKNPNTMLDGISPVNVGDAFVIIPGAGPQDIRWNRL